MEKPNVSWDPAKQALGYDKEQECIPVPLQFEYDSTGKKNKEA